MKNIYIVLAAFLLSKNLIACDICGSGGGNFNPYLFPHLANNFFSVSWNHRFYRTHFTESGEIIKNSEYFNTINLAAQYSPFRKIQFLLVLPIQNNSQYGPEGSKHILKPGDLFFMANYRLLDHRHNDWQQNLLLGAGIKLATGDHSFNENKETEVANPNFQAGSGSTDYLISLYYSIKKGNLSLSTGMNYKFNGTNEEGYRFGNRFQTVTQVKYVKALKNCSLVPSLGIQTEKLAEDSRMGLKIGDQKTGGINTQALLGMDLSKRKWALGLNYTIPLNQNLANGSIIAQSGFNLHLSYAL